MSTMAIATWLKTRRSFAEGVALLKASPDPDEDLLFLLDLGETTVSTNALVKALEELRDAAVERTKDAIASSSSRSVVTKADIAEERKGMARNVQTDGYADAVLPAALRAVHDQVKKDLREMDFLRHRLEMLPSDNDRLRDALRIADLDDAIVSAYARLDAHKATGRDPGPAGAPVHVKNGAELQKELKNIATYLSRAKTGKRPLSEEKQQKFMARQQELKDLIDALP